MSIHALRNKRFFFSLIAVAAVFSLVLAGCGAGQEPSGGSQTEGTSDNTEQANEEGSTRTIEHAMGTTEVPENPQRIVILTNEGTEALLALGITPVGAVKSWLGEPWYDHIKDKMEGVEVVGDELQPNIEVIAGLEPDLIIGSKVRQEKMYDQLSEIAPTVFSETFSGNWQENFALYADAVNKKAEGEKLLSDFDKRIEDAKAKLGDKLSMEVSMVRFLPEGARIYYKDSFSGVLLEKLGFARPESQNKDELAEEVTKERIPEMDGDILFYFVWENQPGETAGQKMAEEWMEDPLWKNLDVVRKGNVHEVSDAIWNTSGGILSANLMLDELLGYFDVK